MPKHYIVFFDEKTRKVKEIKESIIFANGQDNMSFHCQHPDDRLILGMVLDDEDVSRKDEMVVVRNEKIDQFGEFYIQLDDKKIYVFNKDKANGKPIIVDCDVFSGTGYGMLSREFMKRIIKKNNSIFINPINSSGLFQTCLTEEDNVFSHRFISNEDLENVGNNIIHMRIYPPKINFPRKYYNIAYTMLESYTLNHFYIKMMEASYDRFIVPTHFIKNVFSKYIDEDRIKVIPLGVDTNVFNSKVNQEDVVFKKVDLKNKIIHTTNELPKNFKFVSAARFSHRKGCDLVLKAFANEFNNVKDDVSLVLFFLPENENNKHHFHNRVLNILSNYDVDKIPPIYMCDEPWPTNKQHLPYGWADCFVFPSRGEGFGLTPMEAGACKIPVIASCNSGLSDFISDETAFVVPTDKIENVGKMNPVANPDGSFGFVYEGNHPEWTDDIFHQHTWECDFPIMYGKDTIDIIGKHMRYVYENPYSKQVNQRVENFHNLIHTEYNWDILADKLNEEIIKYQC